MVEGRRRSVEALRIQNARTLVYPSNSLLNNTIGGRKQPPRHRQRGRSCGFRLGRTGWYRKNVERKEG